MHKAIAVMQFKIEAQMYHKHPEWRMEDRDLLSNINYEKGTITIGGKEYDLKSNNFPTIDPANPTRLTEEEEALMKHLHHFFMVSEKLHRHLRALLYLSTMTELSRVSRYGLATHAQDWN